MEIHNRRSIAGLIEKPRRPQRSPIPIYLTLTERMFLLHRIANISGVIEAITHHPDPLLHRSPWTRGTICAAAVRIKDALRELDHVLVISEPDRRVLIEGIEGNRYFLRPGMAKLEHIRIAERLRQKLARELGRRIRQFPLPDQAGSAVSAAA